MTNLQWHFTSHGHKYNWEKQKVSVGIDDCEDLKRMMLSRMKNSSCLSTFEPKNLFFEIHLQKNELNGKLNFF